MKRARLYALLLGVVFVFLVAASSRSTALPQPRATTVHQLVAVTHVSYLADDDEEQQEQVFTGTVSKVDEKFVLVGEDSVTYNLDDQDAAKDFDGKKVHVKGTLDKESKTIMVSDIAEVSEDDSGQA
jgi:hypothetical protein